MNAVLAFDRFLTFMHFNPTGIQIPMKQWVCLLSICPVRSSAVTSDCEGSLLRHLVLLVITIYHPDNCFILKQFFFLLWIIFFFLFWLN
jgi:hypothetical protein